MFITSMVWCGVKGEGWDGENDLIAGHVLCAALSTRFAAWGGDLAYLGVIQDSGVRARSEALCDIALANTLSDPLPRFHSTLIYTRNRYHTQYPIPKCNKATSHNPRSL